MSLNLSVSIVATLMLYACGATPATVLDSGSVDSASVDSGSVDSGSVDSGSVDSASVEGGLLDSAPADGRDMRSPDGNSPDSGWSDVGSDATAPGPNLDVKVLQADGQVFIYWKDVYNVGKDDKTTPNTDVYQEFLATRPEYYAIYMANTPISDLSAPGVQRIGRVFRSDFLAMRLHQLMTTTDNNSKSVRPITGSALNVKSPWDIRQTFTLPDGTRLDHNQALFVHTPKAAGRAFFAVVPNDHVGAASSGHRSLPIDLDAALIGLDKIKPHLQYQGPRWGAQVRVYAMFVYGAADYHDPMVMGNQHSHGTAHFFAVYSPQNNQQLTNPPNTNLPAVATLHGGGGHFNLWFPNEPFKSWLPNTPASVVELAPDDTFVIAFDDALWVMRVRALPNGSVLRQVNVANTRWLGYWSKFDRFAERLEGTSKEDDLLPTRRNQDIVVDYTQRRIKWAVDWLTQKSGLPLDPSRVSILGHSMGATGSNMLIRRYPETFSASISFCGGNGGAGGQVDTTFADHIPLKYLIGGRFKAPRKGATAAQPWGAFNPDGNLDTNVVYRGKRMTVYDLYQPFIKIADADIGPSRVIFGRQEGSWNLDPASNYIGGLVPTMKAIVDGGGLYTTADGTTEQVDLDWGYMFYWDNRPHERDQWAGHFWQTSDFFSAQNLTRYSVKSSFPAINRQTPSSDVGAGRGIWDAKRQIWTGADVTNNGTLEGTLNGYLDYSTASIIDKKDTWSVTVFVNHRHDRTKQANDIKAPSSVTADITIRRPQSFKPSRTTKLEFEVFDSGGNVIQQGTPTRLASGAVQLRGVAITREPRRIVVSIETSP